MGGGRNEKKNGIQEHINVIKRACGGGKRKGWGFNKRKRQVTHRMREETQELCIHPISRIRRKRKKTRSFLFWSLSCGKVLRRVAVRKI